MSYTPEIIDTRENATRAYYENMDYDMDGGSLTRCKTFIKACRYFMANPVTRSEQTGSIELDPSKIEARLVKAEEWYHDHYGRNASGTGDTIFADLRSFRD